MKFAIVSRETVLRPEKEKTLRMFSCVKALPSTWIFCHRKIDDFFLDGERWPSCHKKFETPKICLAQESRISRKQNHTSVSESDLYRLDGSLEVATEGIFDPMFHF